MRFVAEIDKEPEDFREVHTTWGVVAVLKKDKLALISTYLFLGAVFFMLFGNLIAPYPADGQFTGEELMPPYWNEGGKFEHFLGTDDLGRDILSRILCGFYYTFGSAFLITLSVAIVGSLLAILTTTTRIRSLDLLSHLFDTFLFIPILLIAIVITILLKPNLFNAMLAIFLAMLPHFIHKINQAIEQELKREYVITLYLDGADRGYLIRKAILPNIFSVIVKIISHVFVIAVLDISALSFIGLGAKQSSSEWGAMIRDSADLIYIAPWTVILPGMAIVLSIFIITVFGNGLVRVMEKYRY